MNRIYGPTSGPIDWKPLLAQPELHWKAGHSAMALAQCWESASGFPTEVTAALRSAEAPELTDLKFLMGIPEYEVALPGGDRPSQTDLMVFARSSQGLVVIAVEGKVDEEFGPTIGEKRAEASEGVTKRLAALERILRLTPPARDNLRYQLLHRTASTVLTADAFNASAAVMLVHSFSRDGRWFNDFKAFAGTFGVTPQPGKVVRTNSGLERPLFLGWCKGEERFLRELA